MRGPNGYTYYEEKKITYYKKIHKKKKYYKKRKKKKVPSSRPWISWRPQQRKADSRLWKPLALHWFGFTTPTTPIGACRITHVQFSHVSHWSLRLPLPLSLFCLHLSLSSSSIQFLLIPSPVMFPEYSYQRKKCFQNILTVTTGKVSLTTPATPSIKLNSE